MGLDVLLSVGFLGQREVGLVLQDGPVEERLHTQQKSTEKNTRTRPHTFLQKEKSASVLTSPSFAPSLDLLFVF